eukprot:13480144-Ditylum_brightwellii.AAC.1
MAWSNNPMQINRRICAYGRHGNAGNFTAVGIGRNKKRAETHGLDTEPTAHCPSHFWSRSYSASMNR